MTSVAKIIVDLPQSLNKEKIPLKVLLEHGGKRSLLLALLIVTLPGLIPFANQIGITFVTSIFMTLFSFQMIFGAGHAWLPNRLRNYEISRRRVEFFSKKAAAIVRFAEKFIKPRLELLADQKIYPLYGILIFLLSVIMLLPIPFFNYPPAFIIALILLGLFQKDGIISIAGAALGGGVIMTLFMILAFTGDKVQEAAQ